MWIVSFYGGAMTCLLRRRFPELPEDREVEALMIEYKAGTASVRQA